VNRFLIDPADETVKQLLEKAKFKCDLEENIQSIQLTKLALNVPFCILMAQGGKTAFNKEEIELMRGKCKL
jgi:ketopantoate reductase